MEGIKQLAKKEDAKFIQRCPDWNGNEVWQLLYDDPEGDVQEIGIPILAMEGPNGTKLMSDGEIDKYMEYTSSLPSPEEREESEIEEV